MSIKFCSQGFGTMEISNTDIPENVILEGLQSGDYLLGLFEGKIYSLLSGDLKHVADFEIDDQEFEHYDFEAE